MMHSNRGPVTKVHKIGISGTEHNAIKYWWDKSTRVWYAILVDAKGNQISDTLDSYHKEDLINAINRGFLVPKKGSA